MPVLVDPSDASRPYDLSPISAHALKQTIAAHQAFLARRPGGRRASLKFRDLSGFDLTGCQLAEADLSGASLRESRLIRTNLRGANLFGADLTQADLSEAILADADMRGVAMRDAILVRTDLSRVDLREGMLMATCAGDIRNTQSEPDMTMNKAQMVEAKLERARLPGASSCTPTCAIQISRALSWFERIWQSPICAAAI